MKSYLEQELQQEQGAKMVERNAKQHSPFAQQTFFGEDDQTGGLGQLFDIKDRNDLVMKSDIPEHMVPIITRMLWKADRYKIPALFELVDWYLMARIGKDRRSREEMLAMFRQQMMSQGGAETA